MQLPESCPLSDNYPEFSEARVRTLRHKPWQGLAYHLATSNIALISKPHDEKYTQSYLYID